MAEHPRWAILAAAPVADEQTVTAHLAGFAQSFVQKERRERWGHLLLKRPQQTSRNSSKLHQHLNRAKCALIADTDLPAFKGMGLYYDFWSEPVLLTMADAFVVGQREDAIFSLVPGELALYFFHEDEIWLCKNEMRADRE